MAEKLSCSKSNRVFIIFSCFLKEKKRLRSNFHKPRIFGKFLGRISFGLNHVSLMKEFQSVFKLFYVAAIFHNQLCHGTQRPSWKSLPIFWPIFPLPGAPPPGLPGRPPGRLVCGRSTLTTRLRFLGSFARACVCE